MKQENKNMPEKLIEELKELMSYWNKLGDKYYKQHKGEISPDLKTLWREKSNGYYKCAERLRGTLIKCGINLEE